MDRAHQFEWGKLQDEAIATLRQSTSQRGYRREFSTLVLPSFGNGRRCEIFRPRSQGNETALVLKTVWKRESDIVKFSTPLERLKYGAGIPLKPTFEQSEIALPANELANLRALAQRLNICPYAAESIVVLDGTAYELSITCYPISATFSWWENLPAGWEPLREFLNAIEDLVSENE